MGACPSLGAEKALDYPFSELCLSSSQQAGEQGQPGDDTGGVPLTQAGDLGCKFQRMNFSYRETFSCHLVNEA